MTPKLQRVQQQLAVKIVRSVMREIPAAGGSTEDIMFLLESVVSGVLLGVVQHGQDGNLLQRFVDRVQRRMADIRFADAARRVAGRG